MELEQKKVHPQHFRGNLANASHGKGFLRLMQQDSTGPQQHNFVVAAFFNRAAAHIDKLPALGLHGGNAVFQTPLSRPGGCYRIHTKRKRFIDRHNASLRRSDRDGSVL